MILETGPLSSFLYHELGERGVPVTCVCARHAKGALSVRVNKSDPHDAEGLAHMSRTGWFKAVHIKQEATHMDRARLKIHAQLIEALLGADAPEPARPGLDQGPGEVGPAQSGLAPGFGHHGLEGGVRQARGDLRVAGGEAARISQRL